jgi:hypothetical protein
MRRDKEGKCCVRVVFYPTRMRKKTMWYPEANTTVPDPGYCGDFLKNSVMFLKNTVVF